VISLAALGFQDHSAVATATVAASSNQNLQLRPQLERLPLAFEKNEGQTSPEVKFSARGSGHSLFLTARDTVLALHRPGATQKSGTSPDSVVRMKLLGCNWHTQVAALHKLSGTSNYFVGNDSVKWRTRIPQYSRVRYASVYPGVDLIYYGNQRQLEFDFIVAPDADPRAIKLQIHGAQQLRIDSQGDLVLRIDKQELRWKKPLAYQKFSRAAGDLRREVASHFILIGKNTVGFRIGEYDLSRALVIDPSLVYSTFLGGSGGDWGRAIVVDSLGNGYVTGATSSPDFPTTPGAFQSSFTSSQPGGSAVFVSKLNPQGSLVYSTVLGGNSALNGDQGFGISVDSSGNAYITGVAGSSDFPTTEGAFQRTQKASEDAFVAKLSSDGSSLVYSTYIGGTANDLSEGIAVDRSGSAIITGHTKSNDFPTTPGAFQERWAVNSESAFVSKLNASGSALVYSTFMAGTPTSFCAAQIII